VRPAATAYEEFRPVGHVCGDRADEGGARDVPIGRRAPECGTDERVGDVVHFLQDARRPRGASSRSYERQEGLQACGSVVS